MIILAPNLPSPFETNVNKDCCRAVLIDGEIYFLTLLSSPSKNDILKWQRGKWSFGLNLNNDNIILYTKIKDGDQDIPLFNEHGFNLKVEPEGNQKSFIERSVIPFYFILIDRDTNLMKSVRTFTLSERFYSLLNSQFKKQLTTNVKPFDFSQIPDVKTGFNKSILKENGGTK